MSHEAEKNLDSLRMIPISEKEEIRFENLLNKNFPVPLGASFFDDFPVWGSKSEADVIRIGALYNDEIIGCAGLRIASLKCPIKNMKIGIIGGVAIDSKFRRQGLASLLVEKLIEAAKMKKVRLIILWGSEHQLYEKLGFGLCGLQVRVPLQKLDLPASKGIIRFGWRNAIFDSMKSRNSGLLIEKKDFKWISSHKNVQWLSQETLTDQSAYVGFNRGIDLRGMVHEWGGPKEQVFNLLGRVKEQIPTAELLGSPEQFKKFGFSFDSDQLEYLCMAKIIDPKEIFSAYRIDVSFHVRKDSEIWTIEVDGKRISGIQDLDLTKIFFGPEGIKGADLPMFPLPLWIWGLDAA